MTSAGLTAKRGGPLRGRVRAPGDKSISHRSLILGALARGTTEIEGLLEGDDVLRTAAAMRSFGAQVIRNLTNCRSGADNSESGPIIPLPT